MTITFIRTDTGEVVKEDTISEPGAYHVEALALKVGVPVRVVVKTADGQTFSQGPE